MRPSDLFVDDVEVVEQLDDEHVGLCLVGDRLVVVVSRLPGHCHPAVDEARERQQHLEQYERDLGKTKPVAAAAAPAALAAAQATEDKGNKPGMLYPSVTIYAHLFFYNYVARSVDII